MSSETQSTLMLAETSEQQKQPQQTTVEASKKSTEQQDYEIRFQSIIPSIMPWEMLSNFERYSIDGLCSIGREVVHDLSTRALNLVSIIRLNATKVHSNTSHISVEIILLYCNLLFEKLIEIRTIIDMRRQKNNECLRIPDESLIAEFSDSRPLIEDSKKLCFIEEFLQIRARIIEVNCSFKQLEWLTAVSDPRLIKKFDCHGDNKR